jgi:hypothetical protein
MESESAYLSRRAREERLAAATARHPKVRAVHVDLAERYEARLRLAETEDRPSAVHLVSAVTDVSAA